MSKSDLRKLLIFQNCVPVCKTNEGSPQVCVYTRFLVFVSVNKVGSKPGQFLPRSNLC